MMSTFLIPFFAFAAVILILLLLYGVWLHFFDRSKHLKKKRLQTIQNTFDSAGQSISSAQDSNLEIWLRSRYRTFARLENRLNIAHVSLTVWGFMGIMLALFTVVVVLGLLRQTNPLLLLVLAVAIASTPLKWLTRKANRRRQAFGDKLPETLDYISRAMRAGVSGPDRPRIQNRL
jgi:tight adherence protein B